MVEDPNELGAKLIRAELMGDDVSLNQNNKQILFCSVQFFSKRNWLNH